ncbi:MAG: HlyC/CorC family transporter [Lachnospiraceae bacterium]|nr:HlyC/CorC family transporter [Lachnospiraceae bacterium]
MDDGASASIIILFFALLLFDAILFGFSKALHLMNDKEIERRAEEEKDKKSILLDAIAKRSTIHDNSIQMIITLINLVMGYFYLPIWADFFEELLVPLQLLEETGCHYLAVLIAVVCLMYVVLTFGILIPKKLAQKYPDQWAYFFVKFIHFLRTVLYPLTWVVAVSANLILTIFRLRTAEEQVDVTEEEIISMVNEGHEQGVLEASEAEMINNILDFGEKEASDIMTHRNSIMAIDKEMLLMDAIQFMLEEGNSRYPVFEENLDHIVGVLHLKDAMKMHTAEEGMNKPIGKLSGLVREAVCVPETKNIDDLFKDMQSQKLQMVIVMDEYGQTAGLVTMEDILEEIVGNIMDEYDTDENHIEEKGNNEYLIEGMTRLEDLEERFGLDFGETDFDTLNGYLISKLERIPDEDESFEVQFGGYHFKIMSVEKNVIQSVLVTKLPEPELIEEDSTQE